MLVKINRGSISPTFAPNFFAGTRCEAFFGERRMVNGAQIWQPGAHFF